jgi:hypothetical protein
MSNSVIVIRRLLLLFGCALALTACRLDVTVDVAIEPDGTGLVTVIATADGELVEQVPGVADDLRLDDAVANGWMIDGPNPTDDGGLTITLTHDVHSAEELANVLNSIGPPLTDMAAARTTDAESDQTTNAIDGQLVLSDGYASFADADLIAAVGGVPFQEELEASGLPPADAMSFTYRVRLPGELISAETGVEVGDDTIEWDAPLDGTTMSVRTQTVQRPAGEGSSWAGPLATISLIALVAWIVLASAFVIFVALARRRKQRRRETRLRRLERDRVT